jgi:hypothetical protein
MTNSWEPVALHEKPRLHENTGGCTGNSRQRQTMALAAAHAVPEQ